MQVDVPSPLQKQTQQVLAMTNASARLGAECSAAFPDAADKWRCLYGEFRAPYVRVPFFLSASQYDSFQLHSNLGHPPPYSRPEAEAVEAFRERGLLPARKRARQTACRVRLLLQRCFLVFDFRACGRTCRHALPCLGSALCGS